MHAVGTMNQVISSGHLKWAGFDGNTQSFLRDAIEELAAADEELIAGEGGRSVQPVIEFIGGQGCKFFPVFENQRGAVAAGDVYPAGGRHS